MANWTSPHSYAVGEFLTSDLLNKYERDNLQYLYDRLKLVAGTETVPQTILTIQTGSTLVLDPGTWLLLATFQGTVQDLKSVRTVIQISGGSTLLDLTGVWKTRYATTVSISVTPATTTTYLARAQAPEAGGTLDACKFLGIRVAV